MDVLLQDGDVVIDHRGAPVTIDGGRALLQRAVIRLALRRGTLPCTPALGSTLHRLHTGQSRAALDAQALAAVREALAPIPALIVREVSCAYDEARQRLTVRVGFLLDGKTDTLEVRV